MCAALFCNDMWLSFPDIFVLFCQAALSGARNVAIRMCEDGESAKLEEEERQKGMRPGLPLKLLPERDAVELLYSAREMLRLHPNLEAARYSEYQKFFVDIASSSK
jgi:hypothetical protein